MWDPIFSWSFPRRIEMESSRFRSAVRGACVRSLCIVRTRDARPPIAHPVSDAVGEDICPRFGGLRAGAKLDISPVALAQFLARGSRIAGTVGFSRRDS